MTSPISATKKTALIHILGQQGVGKSVLASDIVAGMQRRGKTALALTEAGLQTECISPAEVSDLRCGSIRLPYATKGSIYDYLIAEHIGALNPDMVLEHGDVVITIQRVQ